MLEGPLGSKIFHFLYSDQNFVVVPKQIKVNSVNVIIFIKRVSFMITSGSWGDKRLETKIYWASLRMKHLCLLYQWKQNYIYILLLFFNIFCWLRFLWSFFKIKKIQTHVALNWAVKYMVFVWKWFSFCRTEKSSINCAGLLQSVHV